MQAVTHVPPAVPTTGPLKLYFAPMACSLASRIACYEADLTVEYIEVDTGAKRLASGDDFFAINPMGQVPVLEVADGVRLTENTAVLQYLADRAPDASLAPADGFARARLQQWLGFIGTELHKAIFVPLLGQGADAAIKDDARRKVALRLDLVERHLAEHAYLLERFTIADAYLVTVLNWASFAGVDLSAWPAIQAYHRRILERPKVAAALADEFALWKAIQRRKAA